MTRSIVSVAIVLALATLVAKADIRVSVRAGSDDGITGKAISLLISAFALDIQYFIRRLSVASSARRPCGSVGSNNAQQRTNKCRDQVFKGDFDLAKT